MVGRAEAAAHAGSRATSLVGRERELALLGECLAAALAGQGRLVLIGGEAGIGKTALAEALCAEARGRGALALVGQCYDLSETPPYGPWAEAFARAPGGDAPPPPPGLAGGEAATSQAALFAQVRDYLGALATRRPLVLLLDDLHWTDPASLDLLRFLGRQLATLPVLLLTTYRADELAGDHPLATRLPALIREGNAERLDLRPLDDEAVRALVRACYGLQEGGNARLTAHLQGRAEGNPFYLRELLRALEDDGTLRRAGAGWALGDLTAARMPSLLRQILDRRLARLDEATRARLALAALIGQRVPLALWARAAATGEGELLDVAERAVAMHLLEEAPDGAAVRFGHALIREALYQTISPLRRRPIHRRIAEILLADDTPDADAVAYHFRQAGDERAAEWLVRAGERAYRAYAWQMAAERFEAALALADQSGVDAPERQLLLYRLTSLRRYASPGEGIQQLVAAPPPEEAADRRIVAHTLFNRGLLRCFAGEVRDGLTEMAAAITELDRLADDEPTSSVVLPGLGVVFDRHNHRGALAAWLAFAGHHADARAAGEVVTAEPEAAPAAGGSRDSSPHGDASLGLAYVHAALGRPEEAGAAFVRARAAYRAIEHHAMVGITAAHELCWAALPYRTERVSDRRRLAAEAVAAWRRAEGAPGGYSPETERLPLLLIEGCWGEIDRLLPAPQIAGSDYAFFGRGVLAPLAYYRGEIALAWSFVREVLPDGPPTAPGDAHCLTALLLQRLAALLALDAGDTATARDWLEAHERWLAWSGATLGQADGQLAWALYQRAGGDSAAARVRADRALALAGAPRQPLTLLAAHRTLGELDTEAGDFTAARDHLDAALALADACAAPYERALTLLAEADLRRATGDGPGAAALDEAHAICAGLGARQALARIEAAARPVAPAPAPARPDGLSPREVEVLRLIAAGQTNREIAAELSISVRTIERHITNLYGKIGARGKADATAYALRHALI